MSSWRRGRRWQPSASSLPPRWRAAPGSDGPRGDAARRSPARRHDGTLIMRYLEDFAPGQTFRSGARRIDRDEIKSFAGAFDPQPFHLDEETARDTMFRGLAASGWHTAALTMRLLVESDFDPAGGIIGAG